MVVQTFDTDVLILGAGLAGMKAAWSALVAHPGSTVTVVSPHTGPSGSSFANINNRLGMQVCLDEHERKTFIQDVLSIAAPGYVDPILVRLMAEDSERCFRDLVDIGFPFEREDDGEYIRATGCFSPYDKRAFIFSGLSWAFNVLRKKNQSLGGIFLEGWQVQDLIKYDHGASEGVCGVLLQHNKTVEKLAVRSKSVVFALGGPAGLFGQNVAGPGTYGFAPALLNRAGVSLVNTQYIQFLWHTLSDKQYWPIQAFLVPDARIRNRQGDIERVPDKFYGLADVRATHCPVGYDTEDAAVDLFVVNSQDADGVAHVRDPQKGWMSIALMAHAGNGGAKIHKDAWTGIKGLYACGESAGGMHGANRIGGAMVLGTQVFGMRAGSAAAKYAHEADFVDQKRFVQLAEAIISNQHEEKSERQSVMPWLRQGMQKFTVLGGQPGIDAFMGRCLEKLEAVKDWQLRLALESASIIINASKGAKA